MCIACVQNPIDFLDDAELLARAQKFSHEEIKKTQARLIKARLKEFLKEEICVSGSDIIKELEARQYTLSREI